MQHLDYSERLEELSALVQVSPDEHRNYCALAEVLAEVGEYEKALESYARAEAIVPVSVEGAIALAQIVKGRGDSAPSAPSSMAGTRP